MPTLSRIDKLKGAAIFAYFRWPSGLPPFKRYNLIYGWNGSGKTTLSRVFALLEHGVAPGFPALEYQITIDEKTFSHGQPFTTNIRVFSPPDVVS
jgi:wobble nucleotide-excising tRNase